MACAIGCWVKDTVYTTSQRDVEYKKAFLNSMGKSGTIINTAIPGMTSYKNVKKDKTKQDYRDFAWLLKG